MFPGVKSLPKRDSSSVATSAGLTLASPLARALINALERAGYETSALLAAANVRREDLAAKKDGPIPVGVYTAIVNAAQRQGGGNLALKAAAATPAGAYPLIDYLVVSCETIGDAFRQLARYFRLALAPVWPAVYEDEDPIRVAVESPVHPFGAEYLVALWILHGRAETSGRFNVGSIHFTHTPADSTEFSRAFQCPVSVEASWTGFTVARNIWSLPLRRRDSKLRQLLEHHAADLVAQLPSSDRLLQAVRHAIALRVSGGDTRIQTVARQLAMTPRTLQRRLAAHGVVYQRLVDEMRELAAKGHLVDSRLSIGDIAFVLGYADRAAFDRAFVRWTGLTPRAYREGQRE